MSHRWSPHPGCWLVKQTLGLTEDPRRGGVVQGRGWREPLKAISWRLPQSSRRPGRGPWSRKGSITERFYLATALGWLTHGNMVFPQPGLLKFFFSFSKESLFCILIILKCLIINCQGNCNNTDNYMEEKPRKFYHFVTFWRPSFHESLHIYTSTHRGS